MVEAAGTCGPREVRGGSWHGGAGWLGACMHWMSVTDAMSEGQDRRMRSNGRMHTRVGRGASTNACIQTPTCTCMWEGRQGCMYGCGDGDACMGVETGMH
eukprot:350982-Chlamydomonas_euryale.AAC.4